VFIDDEDYQTFIDIVSYYFRFPNGKAISKIWFSPNNLNTETGDSKKFAPHLNSNIWKVRNLLLLTEKKDGEVALSVLVAENNFGS
jgi:hypothetical protein